MPKLVVDKDIGRGLKEIFAQYDPDYPKSRDFILETHAKVINLKCNPWKGDNWMHLNKLSMAQMAQAVFEGYEVEQTPLEKLEAFEKEHTDLEVWMDNYVSGVKKTIQFFKENFEIKGVNVDVQPK